MEENKELEKPHKRRVRYKGTVSYTHLDVYKRQDVHYPMPVNR